MSCLRWATALTLSLAAPVHAAQPQEWLFAVRLDGNPIGTHRFALAAEADGTLSVASDARFEITLLGLRLYRYRHRASERWARGCLASIDAATDDNGRRLAVRGEWTQERFEIRVRENDQAAVVLTSPRCVMTFAYWNQDMARQSRLLDPSSGRIEAVAMTILPSVPDDIGIEARELRGVRIAGLPQPIDVWYQGDRWVGLDTVVDGKRLTYRLR